MFLLVSPFHARKPVGASRTVHVYLDADDDLESKMIQVYAHWFTPYRLGFTARDFFGNGETKNLEIEIR